jgi:hypothetical protein
MQTIKLDIHNRTIFDTIMNFINTLPKNELHISIEKNVSQKKAPKRLSAISIKTKGFIFDRKEANER